MTTTLFLILFLSFFLLEFGINWFLDVLNKRNIEEHRTVPGFFKDLIDEETYGRSRQYSFVNLKFNKWQMLYSSITVLALLFSGILPRLQG